MCCYLYYFKQDISHLTTLSLPWLLEYIKDINNPIMKYSMIIFAQGNKMNNVDVVYTQWSNLRKTAGMDVGQVGFHSEKEVSVMHCLN